MPSSIVNLSGNYRFALEGKIVTMDVDFQVLERGTIYINSGQAGQAFYRLDQFGFFLI